ncbi:SpaA isopeptide-forming pilin-related protein [Bifidobacterium biavatii]|uniref:Cna B-type domain-containing protein n=1 Tax=Bifidobacterium biavatii DSM 23969 TaxID=1437608 RepID=A0A087A5B4_9BIFI|nr:SpaA isopeptide-forming pilin-related protein [Bifidobacterium biavatii]KFI53964.1 Cna B-type domain-containing protein [Bifidobacterium biavatii DSM 23969]
MKLRKLFAGLAAAATLLSGLALGAVPANAAPQTLPFKPLANTNGKTDKVDDNGKILENATFKFTADDASQWGVNNNREIKAFKLADYYQYVTENPKYDSKQDESETNFEKQAFFGVQTSDAAKSGVAEALKIALANVAKKSDDTTAAEKDGKVVVPEGDNAADPIAWALQYGYLDQSNQKPWTTVDVDSSAESTTRKFADALKAYVGTSDPIRKLGRPVTLKVNPDSAGEVALNPVAGDSKSYTADLPAGIYLFLDVTDSGIGDDGNVNTGKADSSDKNWIQNGTTNDSDTKGEVVVNSAPIILASGHVTSEANGESYLYPIGNIADGDNSVSFKNHVTPVTKTVDDSDKTVSTGQIVRYTLSTTLPLTTGYDPSTYVFTLQDFPGEGQTVNLDGFKDAQGNVVSNGEKGASNAGEYTVKVYDTDGKTLLKVLKADTDYTLTTSAENNGHEIVGAENKASWFKLDFSELIRQDLYNNGAAKDDAAGTAEYKHLWGMKVVVEYAAKITATVKDVPNQVEVNDNNAIANHGTNLTLGQFTFFKTDAQGNAGEDINGATFVISKDDDTKDNTAVTPNSPDFSGVSDTNRDGQVDDDDIDHVKSPWGGDGINESDSRTASVWNENHELVVHNGVVTFYGLADGTYVVKETRAPAGFLGGQVAVSFKVTIKGGKAVKFDGIDKWGLAPDSADNTESGNEITDYKVKNVRNVTQLPLTGGMGIILFGTIGLIIAGGAVAVFLRSRKTKMALMMA